MWNCDRIAIETKVKHSVFFLSRLLSFLTKIVNEVFMKKLLFCALFVSVNSFAWGPIGHRIVGKIAENHLDHKAKKALDKIMGPETLAIVSNWPDFIRSDQAWAVANTWHFVTIPEGQTYETIEKDPHGDVVEAIARFQKILKDKKSSMEEKQQAVKFITHFVGDIHQPLHVGKETDRGGNSVKVKWFNADTNLHHVWDEGLINYQQLSYTEYAAMIDHAKKEEKEDWQNDDIAVWIKESMDARPMVYDIGTEAKLGYDYNFKNIKLLNERLLKAGIRLAKILNDSLK